MSIYAKMKSGFERGHARACQFIGAFVFGVSGVAFDPFPSDRMARLRGV
jgi:hypothetical protein